MYFDFPDYSFKPFPSLLVQMLLPDALYRHILALFTFVSGQKHFGLSAASDLIYEAVGCCHIRLDKTAQHRMLPFIDFFLSLHLEQNGLLLLNQCESEQLLVILVVSDFFVGGEGHVQGLADFHLLTIAQNI